MSRVFLFAVLGATATAAVPFRAAFQQRQAQPMQAAPGIGYTPRIALGGWRYVLGSDFTAYPKTYPVRYVDIGPAVSAGANGIMTYDITTGAPIGPIGPPGAFCIFGLIDVTGGGFPAGSIQVPTPYATLPTGTTSPANAYQAAQDTWKQNWLLTRMQNPGVFNGFMVNAP